MIDTTTVEAEPTAHIAGPPQETAPRIGFGLVGNTLLGYTLMKGLQLTLFQLIFPLYLYSLGFNQEAIGRINAIGALTVLLVSVPVGMLADRIGLARALAISAIISPLTLVGTGLAESLPTLIVWFVLQNALSVTYWSATSPLLVAAVPEHRRVRIFSVNSFFLWGLGSLGSLIGGQIAAAAAHRLSMAPNDTPALRVALLAIAAFMFLGGLPLWRITNRARASDSAEVRQPLRASDLRLFGRLLLPDILQACGAGAIVGFLPLFFSLRFGLQSDRLGLLFTFTGILGGVAALSAPVVARALGNLRAIAGLMCAVAGSVMLTVLAPILPAAIGGELLRAGLRGTIDPIYTPFVMSRVAPTRRGTLSGLYNVTYATGFSLGPLASGWLQVHYGFGPAFFLSASVYLIAAASVWLLWPRLAPHRE